MAEKRVTVELTISDRGGHDEHELMDWLNWQLNQEAHPILDSFDIDKLDVTRVRRVSDAETEDGDHE